MPHTTEIPVTWGDTDAGGLIYFPRFFHYAVVGLNAYFAPAVEGGHLMETLRAEGLVLPAVETSASFETPLRAGDTASVRTTVRAVGESSLSVEVEVRRLADGERAGTVEVTFVLVDEAFEATALPRSVRDCVTARGDGEE